MSVGHFHRQPRHPLTPGLLPKDGLLREAQFLEGKFRLFQKEAMGCSEIQEKEKKKIGQRNTGMAHLFHRFVSVPGTGPACGSYQSAEELEEH